MVAKEKFLKVLARQYPTVDSIISELVNLQAILNLPKGTEHFLSDIHGEWEQFDHVLRNGSGSVRAKIEEVFGNRETVTSKRELATLIYYPKEKLEIVKQSEADMADWYTVTLHKIIEVLRRISSKYTRSRIRAAIPQQYAYIAEELITEKEEINNKAAYYNNIIQNIIKLGAADSYIEIFCNVIQQLAIAHLHIIGDIFDRGNGPHTILDKLMTYHSVDIQWGNHDVVWMGAAGGNAACIANVVRLCARYKSLEVLEEGYGINLTPVVAFCVKNYGGMEPSHIHKAMSILQFKLEAKIIKENPEFEMDDRLLLDKINFEKGTVVIGGKEWKLNTKDFPTINKDDPYALTEAEENVISRLRYSFMHCEKLQKHVEFLFQKGALYKVINGNLLYHGCVPVDEKGNLLNVKIFGKEFAGKALYDEFDKWVRRGFFAPENSKDRERGGIIMWYLWEGPNSPLFGKDKMALFETAFIDDKEARKEHKSHYYSLVDNADMMDRIMENFGLNPKTSHIVNGHVPQAVKKGEFPIKSGGKLLIIDGGFAAAYHEHTGIAGYTLVCNSYGMRLVMHKKFTSKDDVLNQDSDIVSDTMQVELFPTRHYVADTDTGREILERISELETLLSAYRAGAVS